MTDKLFGGIEAGGTKFICIVASGPGDIRAQARFDTSTPFETLSWVVDFFKQESLVSTIEAIGIGSFGPLDLNPVSPTFGFITTTPKPGWMGTDLAGTLRRSLSLPVEVDTDVNAAALAEGRWGAAQNLSDFIYLTVGTGIGGGAVTGGKLVHGLVHPEMGHLLIRHDFQKDPFPGCCPFHADCLEGLASGTAMRKRWGCPAQELPFGHPAWKLEGEYLAQGIVNLICTLSPRRIILGGGVAKAPQILPWVRSQVISLLNSYVSASEIRDCIDEYIVAPTMGDLAGVMGAICLAQKASLNSA